MLDLIREGWDRLVRFFSGGEEVTTGEVLAESSPPRIPAGQSSTSSESPLERDEFHRIALREVRPALHRG